MFTRHPRETAVALAEAANAGNNVPPPSLTNLWRLTLQGQTASNGGRFQPPTLNDPRNGPKIDGGIAALLADRPGPEMSPGLYRVAGLWGGPVTAALLSDLQNEAAHSDEIKQEITSAIESIQRRVDRDAEQNG